MPPFRSFFCCLTSPQSPRGWTPLASGDCVKTCLCIVRIQRRKSLRIGSACLGGLRSRATQSSVGWYWSRSIGHNCIKSVGRKDSDTIVKTAKSHNKAHDVHGGVPTHYPVAEVKPFNLTPYRALVGDEARGSPRQPVKRRRGWSDQIKDASYWLGIAGENYET